MTLRAVIFSIVYSFIAFIAIGYSPSIVILTMHIEMNIRWKDNYVQATSKQYCSIISIKNLINPTQIKVE